MTRDARMRALKSQIRRVQQNIQNLNRLSYRYSWIRLVIFGAVLLFTGLAGHFVGLWLAGVVVIVCALLFGIAVYCHRQVNESIRRHQAWLRVKRAQIARASLHWATIPPGFQPRRRPEHPFEADLDLVGQRSLHRLLDTAVSYEGSQRLRDWLTAPIPDRRESLHRQQLVRELVPLSLFRDKLILNATVAVGAERTWKANHLVEWLEQRGPEAGLLPWLLLLVALAGLNAILFVTNWFGVLPPWWQFTFVIYLGLLFWQARTMEAVWDETLALQGALRQLRTVFKQLENFAYHNTPQLQKLCAPFLDQAHRPSKFMGRVTRVVTGMGLRSNPLVWFLLNALVPWDLYFAHELDRCKLAIARHAPSWMDTWFELEALSSLANFAYLNPDYTFPDLLDPEDLEQLGVFQAEALGHPLLAYDEKVCNNFSLSNPGQVRIITGSNMAGKSVFLKTVGVNLALANAGGPVNAASLRSVPFRLFTCLGITDSVTDGISYFYAEVKRLKALLEELERDHALPLLFCIDEIFRGTNNRERLIGSRAYVRALAGKNGVGFIATHDLELAKLADEVSQVQNFHFRDSVVGDRMAFDFILRPGPCPTTNALSIMQLEGLPVPGSPGFALTCPESESVDLPGP